MTSKKPAKKSTRKPTKKVVTASLVELTPVSGYVEPVIPNPVQSSEFDHAGAVTLPSPEPSNLQKTWWQRLGEWWDK